MPQPECEYHFFRFFFQREKKMLFEFAVKVIKIKQQERLGGEVHSTEAGLLNKSSCLGTALQQSHHFACDPA